MNSLKSLEIKAFLTFSKSIPDRMIGVGSILVVESKDVKERIDLFMEFLEVDERNLNYDSLRKKFVELFGVWKD